MTYLIGYLAIGLVVFSAAIWEEIKTIRADRNALSNSFLEKIVIQLVALVLIFVLWPVAIYMMAKDRLSKRASEIPKKKVFFVARENLVRRMTIEEIELREHVNDPMGAVPDLPFGHLNTAWLRFKGNLKPDDSCWAFTALYVSDWQQKEIREGYVIVRSVSIGPHFVTSKRMLKAR